MRDFVVKTAPISGVNLVEASAGTGKTFSVGILVLRCLLEKKLPIGKILMVTFTKVAVAELEERVRKFVRIAYDVAFGNTEFNKEDIIHDLVRASLIKDTENTKKILVRALSHLDELSVMTIHSFCEKNLKEFAFSSGQMFQQEIIADEADLIARFAEEYWQNLLCGEDKEIVVSNPNVSFSDFKDRIKNFLKGEELQALDVIGEDPIGELDDLLKNEMDGLLAYSDNPNDKNGKKFKNAIEKENINLSNTTDLLDFLKPKISNVYVKEIPSPYIEAIHAVLKYEIDVPSYIYKKGLHEIAEKVRLHKESRALLSYDDLITKMHDAVIDPEFGESFVTNVSKNYWAVFIDEFQDTDEKQHRIFETIFAQNARVLYYIGDPKQSIYSWRSADLDVYDAAKEAVKSDHQFTMTTNFRSEEKYVNAINALYKSLGEDDFSRKGLRYIPVGAKNSKDSFTNVAGEERLNIKILDKDKRFKTVAQKIEEVLNSKQYSIADKAIVASDIGVLVRSGREAIGIKNYLEELGIPSILRDGASVFKSDEALFVLNILRAIEKVNQKNIGVALVGSYFGISSSEWPNRNTEADLIFFKEIQVAFPERGVLSVINQVLNHYRFFEQTNQLGAGDRMQSNVQQLNELLYEQQNRGSEQLADLCQYIERERKSTFTSDEDDREKRIESDENAVQISTIHKAKGLQYNLVFALTDFNIEPFSTSRYFSYKNAETKKKLERYKHSAKSKVSLPQEELIDYEKALEWHNVQSNEENLRSIYVMLTRAVYASYLFVSEKDKGTFKSISEKIQELQGSDGICTHFEVNKEYPRWEVTIQEESKTVGLRSTENLQPFAGTYYTQSYSSLSGHAYQPIEKTEYAEAEKTDYDTYVFDVLPKGAQAGTFMHELFEVANFSDSESWKKTVEKQCKRYGGKYEKDDHKTGLVNLIRNTVESDLGDGLTLDAIDNDGKLNEMEFFLTTKDWDVLNNQIVMKHFGERLSLNYDKVPDGFLNGFIDLIFEHNGRYHVLDWKSNHLGNNVANYTADKLDEAMTNSNYHLQYLIYSIALYRYLKQVLGSQFDYDSHMGNVYYLFFRGLRSGQSTGVFTTIIPLEVLQQFD